MGHGQGPGGKRCRRCHTTTKCITKNVPKRAVIVPNKDLGLAISWNHIVSDPIEDEAELGDRQVSCCRFWELKPQREGGVRSLVHAK